MGTQCSPQINLSEQLNCSIFRLNKDTHEHDYTFEFSKLDSILDVEAMVPTLKFRLTNYWYFICTECLWLSKIGLVASHSSDTFHQLIFLSDFTKFYGYFNLFWYGLPGSNVSPFRRELTCESSDEHQLLEMMLPYSKKRFDFRLISVLQNYPHSHLFQHLVNSYLFYVIPKMIWKAYIIIDPVLRVIG